MVSEKIVLFFFHFRYMGAIDQQGVANLDSGGMVGRIYVKDH